MKTQTRIMFILATITSVAIAAEAQVQERNQQPRPKPAGFNCPVCNSPCISKADVVRQRHQINARQRYHADRPALARQHQGAYNRGQEPRRPDGMPRALKQKAMRFDFDGSGDLSTAERAALKAYRAELNKERSAGPVDPSPVEE